MAEVLGFEFLRDFLQITALWIEADARKTAKRALRAPVRKR